MIREDENDNYICTLASDLGKLLDTGEFHDLTLEIDGQQLRVHKPLLHARFARFADRFLDGDSSVSTKRIEGFSFPAVANLMRLLYTDRVSIRSAEENEEFRRVAFHYGIDRVQRLCGYVQGIDGDSWNLGGPIDGLQAFYDPLLNFDLGPVVDAEEAWRRREQYTLAEDMRVLFYKSLADGDVTFILEDGKSSLKTYRSILSVRSAFFQGKLDLFLGGAGRLNY